MIGRVAGRIVHRGEGHVIIEAGGIGYVVQVAERTLAALPAVGEAAALWTELLVREDALTLVGFESMAEKEWHRLLTSVQGVGAKAAMAMIGALGPERLARAVALGDWQALKAAPGVGPKLAQRVTNELKDRAPALVAGGSVAARLAAGPAPQGAEAEAMSALAHLGYAPGEAARAVAEVAGEGAADTAALIRAALRRLAPA